MDDMAYTRAHDGMNKPALKPRPVLDPEHATDNHFDILHGSPQERRACRICNGETTTLEAARLLHRSGFSLEAHDQPNPAGPKDLGVA